MDSRREGGTQCGQHFSGAAAGPFPRARANSRASNQPIKTVKRNLISIVVLLAAMNSTATLTVKARSLSGEEEHFVMEAASGGVAKVKLSELAKNRASDGKVRLCPSNDH